jgi:hypothetical protein
MLQQWARGIQLRQSEQWKTVAAQLQGVRDRIRKREQEERDRKRRAEERERWEKKERGEGSTDGSELANDDELDTPEEKRNKLALRKVRWH